MNCMDSNNFEQPGPGKPVNASRHRKKILLSCHGPRNKPLELQPFSSVSVHWCCAQPTISKMASQPAASFATTAHSAQHACCSCTSRPVEPNCEATRYVTTVTTYIGQLPGIRVRDHSHHRGSWLNPHATRPIM